MALPGTWDTIQSGGWFSSDGLDSFVENMSDGWWTSAVVDGVGILQASNAIVYGESVKPTFTLSIFANPSQGKLPLVSIISSISNTSLKILQWYVNNTLQSETTPSIRLTFTKTGIYTVKLIATDIYDRGPKIATVLINVYSTLSIIDSALLVTDPNRFMELNGTASVIHASKVGMGIKASITSNFKKTGFTHEQGPNLIFS